MGDLQFNIYFCWMSEETFSEQIMIYKPISTITRCFTEAALQKFEIATVGELIDYLKDDIAIKESLGTWGLAHLSTATVYIQHHGYLLGMREEKTISEIFRDLETSEKIHEHLPHVHVSKAGVEIRYSLESLLPMDSLVNPHKRDNKKIITPFLQRNQERLLEMWSYYTKGYTTPEITQEGQQFYSES